MFTFTHIGSRFVHTLLFTSYLCMRIHHVGSLTFTHIRVRTVHTLLFTSYLCMRIHQDPVCRNVHIHIHRIQVCSHTSVHIWIYSTCIRLYLSKTKNKFVFEQDISNSNCNNCHFHSQQGTSTSAAIWVELETGNTRTSNSAVIYRRTQVLTSSVLFKTLGGAWVDLCKCRKCKHQTCVETNFKLFENLL